MRVKKLSLVLAGVLLIAALTVTHGGAQAASGRSSAQAVVTTYFRVLNDGIKSGDFSALASVYARDATFTQSNPLGVTKVFRGLKAITGFYTAFQKVVPGLPVDARPYAPARPDRGPQL